jgi:hypothetical protein
MLIDDLSANSSGTLLGSHCASGTILQNAQLIHSPKTGGDRAPEQTRTLSRVSEDDTENDLILGSSGGGGTVFCWRAKTWPKGARPYMVGSV